jgi:hypothetical protein
MSREAMKQALEALESDPVSHAGLVNRKQAITALRQALETEKQWQGLTDEDVSYFRYAATFCDELDTAYMAELIEKDLKEKNKW